MYKIILFDDRSIKMKPRIVTHWNKDKERQILETDSSQSRPIEMCILSSVAAVRKFPVAKIDFISSSLQTSGAKRDVYVTSPLD